MDLSVQVIPARVAAASFPLTSTKPPATLQHTEDQSEVFFAESCTLEVACPWKLTPPRGSNPLGRLARHSLDRMLFGFGLDAKRFLGQHPLNVRSIPQ